MNDYNINILVNGNKCKKFYHLGKTFIEAKQGSEYAIEIKNNEWKRILAVCAIDSLNILNGKNVTEDGPGYVLDNFSSTVLDGFRYDNNRVAKFVFDYKNLGNSYAASKGNGSEKNVGVIGIRIFDEKVAPVVKMVEEHHHHYHHDHWLKQTPWINPWSDITYGSPAGGPTYTCNSDSSFTRCADAQPLGLAGDTMMDNSPKFVNCCQELKARSCDSQTIAQQINTALASQQKPIGFDMGTKWGDSKESRVREVTFERGILVLSTNIYYASRQSLIEMGVPLGNEKQVNFPTAFADSKYATPPSGWNG
jgi:hypothetical protein